MSRDARCRFFTLLVLSCACLSSVSFADDARLFECLPVTCGESIGECGCAEEADSLWSQSKLTGDWFGGRTSLAESGITVDLRSTQYYQGVASGGLRQDFEYGGRNDYFLNVDGEKAGLWKGSFITLHGETRYGNSVNPLTGAFSPANLALSLPARNGTVTGLTGVKFTQFLSETSLVYGGKINTFDGFLQPITGAGMLNGFQNISLMIPMVFARTVPYSTFGAGFVQLQGMEPVFSFSVFDTNDHPTTSGFDTFFDNGVTMISQVNLPTQFFDLPGHQGISGTYSTGKYTNVQPTFYRDPIEGIVLTSTPKQGSWSLNWNFDQAFYVSADDPKRKWGLFGNLGIADNNPSPVGWHANVGLSGSSPLQGRELDQFGMGYYYLGVSESIKNLAPILLPARNEQGVELYYNIGVTPWCHITPDLQVIDPFRKNSSTSVICGIRASIDF